MYKIIGADQREYGPVTADQIREWIAEGRANGATLVQAEDATEWNPLSSFPEFADALSVRPLPPAPAEPIAPTDPMGLADHVRARDYHVDIGRCFARSWELFKENFGVLIGATVILVVLIFGVNQVIGLFTRNALESLMSGNIAPGPILTIMLWNIPEVAFSTVMTAGLYSMLFKLVRGQPAGLGEVFAGFHTHFAQLALAGIVIQFLTILGILACVVPGIYLSVAWILTVPLILDRNLDFWPAMELSRKVVTQHWWMMFCLFLVVALASLLGLLACCVGLVVALPVGLGAFVYAYEDIFRGPGSAGS